MLPAVDAVLRASEGLVLVERFGRQATTDAIRATLAELREQRQFDTALTFVIDIAAEEIVSLSEAARSHS